MIIFSVLLSMIISSQVLAGTDRSTKAIDSNRQGIELLKKQNFTAAQEKFATGLAESPFASELQVNLGLAFDGAGNVEKSRQAYELAAKNSTDAEVRFAANFNLGELAGREKKVDQALSYYQLALKDKPDSIEAKTNIELLVQDQKNQSGKDGQQDKENKENKDKKDKKDKDEKEKEKPKDGYDKNKPQPKPFKSDKLNPGDVKKILDELDRQEQRVRAEYNKKQIKERPRDKDW